MGREDLAHALGRAVGRTLAGMFAAGACHPDLNAANLLVGADGRVQVIDFDLPASAEPSTRLSASAVVTDNAATIASMVILEFIFCNR